MATREEANELWLAQERDLMREQKELKRNTSEAPQSTPKTQTMSTMAAMVVKTVRRVSFSVGTKTHDGMNQGTKTQRFDRLGEWFFLGCKDSKILATLGLRRSQKLSLTQILSLPGYGAEMALHTLNWIFGFLAKYERFPNGKRIKVIYAAKKSDIGKKDVIVDDQGQPWVFEMAEFRHQVTPCGGGGGTALKACHAELVTCLFKSLIITQYGKRIMDAIGTLQTATRLYLKQKKTDNN